MPKSLELAADLGELRGRDLEVAEGVVELARGERLTPLLNQLVAVMRLRRITESTS